MKFMYRLKFPFEIFLSFVVNNLQTHQTLNPGEVNGS